MMGRAAGRRRPPGPGRRTLEVVDHRRPLESSRARRATPICSGRAMRPVASTKITRSPSPSRANPPVGPLGQDTVDERLQIGILSRIGTARAKSGSMRSVERDDVVTRSARTRGASPRSSHRPSCRRRSYCVRGRQGERAGEAPAEPVADVPLGGSLAASTSRRPKDRRISPRNRVDTSAV